MTAIWKWHCIRFATARAAIVENDLIERHVPVYFPLRWERVVVGRERQWKVAPRLGHYAFVQINHDPIEIAKAVGGTFIAEQVEIITAVRGVSALLSDRDCNPDPIRAWQIENIRAEVAREKAEQDMPPSKRHKIDGIPSDTEVRITKGPFEGFNGKVVMYEGHGMIRVEIEMFGRASSTVLADCDVEISTKPARRRA